MHDDDDDLKAWERMAPVGRERGAPHADTLWALSGVANRLQESDLHLVEDDDAWHLAWQGRELARWAVQDTDWQALRRVVASACDAKTIALWDAITAERIG